MYLEHMIIQMTRYMYNVYRNKTAKVFIDFLKRVDKRYDKNIQNIFVVLDNLSVHKSKRVTKRDIQILSKNKICIFASKITNLI